MGSQEGKIDIRIDPATERDVPVLLNLIKGLAEYERLSGKVAATEASLHAAFFGQRPVAEAVLARVGSEPVGSAIFFLTFSTFAGRTNLYLEDLYVEPQWRRRGVGRMLMAGVARIAVERGCAQMNWSVLGWNEPALNFYRAFGAEPVQEWVGYKLAGDAFRRLAGSGTRG